MAQALHYRRHGLVLPKRQDALKEATLRIHEEVPGAESLQRMNDMLQRDHRVRLVVLDWSQHDEPFFVGAGHDDDDVVFLYKMQAEFHLLLNPEKIKHSQQHLTLCRRCFFFFSARRKTAHVCGERQRRARLSQMPGRCRNRSVRCDALDDEDFVSAKRSVVKIVDRPGDPGGGGCAFKAVALGTWLLETGKPSKYCSDTLLRERALALCQKSGLPWGPCGPPELTRMQEVLRPDGIRLHVYYQHLRMVGFAPAWLGLDPPRHDLYLYHHHDHYDVITSMKGFLRTSYYCTVCDKGYHDKKGHGCQPYCPCCKWSADECVSEWREWQSCGRCHRSFRGEVCFQNHLQSQPHAVGKGRTVTWSTCDQYQRCPDCQKVFDVKRRHGEAFYSPLFRQLTDHVCGEVYCRHCKKTTEAHWCYVQPVLDQRCDRCQAWVQWPHECGGKVWEASDVETKYLFFDVESMPSEPVHRVNLVVAHKVCGACLDSDDRCDVCQDRKVAFDTREAFCEWLFRPEHSGYTVMAHNFKGYDSYFLLEYLCQKGERPEVTFRGAKLLYMYLHRLDMKFKDSLCFLPMPLRKFSSTFGLREEKGHFPHFFNRPENQQYVGPMPPLEDYGIATMNEDEAQALRDWYAEQAGRVFDFQKELRYYCEQDVELLKRGVLAARRIFLAVTGFDPFRECITLASACMRSYLRNFMPPDTIGIVPREGYRGRAVQSSKAKKWLWWLQHHDPRLKLQTCLSFEGEKTLLGAPVDGYDDATGTVYQFHGCFWHWCPLCYGSVEKDARQLEYQQRFYDTEQRTEALRREGYQVVEMWEHEWDALQIPPATFPDFLEHSDPLNPRDGLFGGRTNALHLYYEAQPGEKIYYSDFTSLYPWAQLCPDNEYPIGHPEILLASEGKIQHPVTERYYGLNKVKVIPPQDLYLPVLPIHEDGKLMFVNCLACARAKQTTPCRHNAEQRALVGVWTTPELKKAVEVGYRIVDAYEVWHYPQTSHQLFEGYVRTYLKIKQEASGWPSWCQTDDDRQRYVSDYETHQGIRLDPAKIEKNPGMRSLAKLMLNNLWGKFGQNPHMITTEYVTDPARFAELMFSGRVEMNHLLLIQDELVQMQYVRKREFERESSFASVVHANFVTTFARLRLYSRM